MLLRTVSYGETVTYGELAQRAVAGPDGIRCPARAIGRIMGSNPIPVIVPCHRVVAGNGLGGYSGGTGIEVKRWLLIFEGALPATLDWDVSRGLRVVAGDHRSGLRVSSASIGPSTAIDSAAARGPARAASCGVAPAMLAAIYPPAKLSPAPSVSTGSDDPAGITQVPSRVSRRAPCGPSVAHP